MGGKRIKGIAFTYSLLKTKQTSTEKNKPKQNKEILVGWINDKKKVFLKCFNIKIKMERIL